MEKTATVLVCFALEVEAAAFRARVRGRPDIQILLTGVGPRQAGQAVRRVLPPGRPGRHCPPEGERGGGTRPPEEAGFAPRENPPGLHPCSPAVGGPAFPELVLSCGFAGGLNPRLAPGQVVFEAGESSRWAARLQAAGATPARLHTSPRIVATAAEKRALWEQTGVDAVEMESEAVRQVCRERLVPCVTVRVISDAAGEDLPLDFTAILEPEGRWRSGRLALALLQAPGRWPALWRLHQRSRRAAANLARVLAEVIAG
jgi:hypothetical protein